VTQLGYPAALRLVGSHRVTFRVGDQQFNSPRLLLWEPRGGGHSTLADSETFGACKPWSLPKWRDHIRRLAWLLLPVIGGNSDARQVARGKPLTGLPSAIMLVRQQGGT
jgi:hypothetical protein